jgi:hypothetical protein
VSAAGDEPDGRVVVASSAGHPDALEEAVRIDERHAATVARVWEEDRARLAAQRAGATG